MTVPSNAKNLFSKKISAADFIETARNLAPDDYQRILVATQPQPQVRKDALRLISFELMGLIMLIALAIVAFILLALQPPREVTAIFQPLPPQSTPTVEKPFTQEVPLAIQVKINTCLSTDSGLTSGYQYQLVPGELKPFAGPCMSDGFSLTNTSEITLEIKPPPPPLSRRFEGRVTLSGESFLGARVALMTPASQGWEPVDFAISDEQGHYQLIDYLTVQPEQYRIEVNSPSDSYVIQELQSAPASGWRIVEGNAIESESAKGQGESDLNFDFTLSFIRLGVDQATVPSEIPIQNLSDEEHYSLLQLVKPISVTWDLSRLPYRLPGKYVIKVWTPPGAYVAPASFTCESGKNKPEFVQTRADEKQWRGFEDDDRQWPLSLDSLSVVCTLTETPKDKQWRLGPIGLFPVAQ